ncbi:MAG TPA: DEAD/DEAH box helicase [Bacteroidia bacterium]|nr:DEAD/DEAH box helicase [Bacteroidia bacterium]
MANFTELGLREELVSAVNDLGFTQPTPIQEQAIPLLITTPADLVGLARTGTGKTAAFGLPLLNFIDVNAKIPQALVLCPTRELCMQISEDLKSFAKHMRGVYILPVYGGSSISMQIKDLKRGVQVVVGTPGRLIDLIERGALKLGEVQTVVLDEADEMLNMGFRDDIDTILAETPAEKKTWLFSATMPEGVARIARKYMHDPVNVSVKGAHETDGQIDHIYCVVNARERYQSLRRVIDAHPDIYGIVFCRTKAETQEVADHLIRDGYTADALHGDLSQAQRDFVMKRFRHRTIRMLVATDVAARGIDVDDITHVLHYQLPDEPESYTHRSGRTGRAGKSGVSILFIHAREMGRLRETERRINKKFAYMPVPSGVDVLKNQVLSFANRIREGADVSVPHEYLSLFNQALGEMDTDALLQKIISFSLKDLFSKYENAPDLNAAVRPDKPEKFTRHEERPTGEVRTFFFSLGRMDNVDPGVLLRICCDRMNVSKRAIGRIDLKHNFSFIQTIGLPSAKVLDAFKNFSYQGRKVRVNEAENGEGERRGGESSGWGEKRGRKDYGERSFPVKKEFRGKEKSSFTKQKSDFAPKKFHDDTKKNHDADSWQSLMKSEEGSDRKKKFKKK